MDRIKALLDKSPDINSQHILGTDVVIYGAGNYGKRVCSALLDRGVNVRFFIDRNAKPGDEWQGIPVWRLYDLEQERRDLQVMVAVFNRDADPGVIEEDLRNHGFTNIVSGVETYAMLSDDLGQWLWLAKPEIYRENITDIFRAYDMLGDEASRSLYASLIEYRLTGNHSALPEPDLTNQYFLPELPSWKLPLRLVDCGAYDGDTIRDAIDRGFEIEALAAFEPDEGNFRALTEMVSSSLALKGAEVYLSPCALGAGAGTIRFTAGEGESSRACDNGAAVVECVSLDESIPDFRPNLLKLDVEGAECDVLLGAGRLMTKHRPGLAVCAYHNPEHLWQIPIMIREMVGGYKLYLRLHGYNGLELVVYGIPDEYAV